jgi:prostaglandin-E synthase
LLKDHAKPRWLKVDWNKWKDEDELDEEDTGFDMGGMGNFDFSSLGGAGGLDGGFVSVCYHLFKMLFHA